jgi:hypothetical protein
MARVTQPSPQTLARKVKGDRLRRRVSAEATGAEADVLRQKIRECNRESDGCCHSRRRHDLASFIL